MSIVHTGTVRRVRRLPNAVEITADFPDRGRTFYVRPTNTKIGPCVRITVVSGHPGPVGTGPADGPFVGLSHPMNAPPNEKPHRESAAEIAPHDKLYHEQVVIDATPQRVKPLIQICKPPGHPTSACVAPYFVMTRITVEMRELMAEIGCADSDSTYYWRLAREIWDTVAECGSDHKRRGRGIAVLLAKARQKGYKWDVLKRVAGIVLGVKRQRDVIFPR